MIKWFSEARRFGLFLRGPPVVPPYLPEDEGVGDDLEGTAERKGQRGAQDEEEGCLGNVSQQPSPDEEAGKACSGVVVVAIELGQCKRSLNQQASEAKTGDERLVGVEQEAQDG